MPALCLLTQILPGQFTRVSCFACISIYSFRKVFPVPLFRLTAYSYRNIMANEPKCLIVGVDYGTTFSGVSYVWSDAVGIENVRVMDKWGSSSTTDGRYFYQKQVPSKIAYDPFITWGYNIEAGKTAYCWTKLLLDRHAPITDFDDSTLDSIYGPGLLQTPTDKNAEAVVTDYLAELYKHIMLQLAREISESILQVTPIRFWFTRPALWSPLAEEATKNTATQAGFASRPGDRFHMIREPEAAAIACLNELIKNGPSDLVRQGTGVLVCDCGGGTVDLASYKILAAYPKIILDQACVSEGGKCGSTTIDRALHKLMRDRFGEAFEKLPLNKTGANSKFMNQFESAKRDFGTFQLYRTHRLNLKLGGIENPDWYDSDDDEVLLTSDDIRSLFDPVVQQITSLIDQQINATEQENGLKIKVTLVLVGGFGESNYLYDKVKAWCPAHIELINPAKSWEAVCIGAAMRGLDGPVVTKRKSKWHIGHPVGRKFQEDKDYEEHAYISKWDGLKYAGGQMDWMLARGESVTTSTMQERAYWRVWIEGDRKEFTVDLFLSQMAVAPTRVDSDSVRKLGQLVVDLTHVDFKKFERKKISSNNSLFRKVRVYKVEFSLVMVAESDLGYMQFHVKCHNQRVGTARLEYAGEDS